ncbi:hypothetical protein ACROYT_G013939 [Oculina patagonica]
MEEEPDSTVDVCFQTIPVHKDADENGKNPQMLWQDSINGPYCESEAHRKALALSVEENSDAQRNFRCPTIVSQPMVPGTDVCTMNEDSGDAGRKKPRRSESGSQTEDNGSCSGCCNMADIIAEMNLALARIVEIDQIKEKQKQLENTNAHLERSLQFTQESISKLSERVVAHEKTISELEKGVNELTKSANFEKEWAIKLESHSRRNNLKCI